ncbi:hypothetical protein SAMN04487967_2120 [Natronorubrum sediminis]|uniref:Uncharacterized protein n=1 Tax=Natronorubrum sediminis TaxID=640943 RepID=A0A1H6FXL2_9EURY|nr:hypothetical protein [Natronorubrum sediminis]SEH15526.1 hypothetical protein SAMN04487967_2120 [Natronorubrum sediminis]
MNGYLMRVSGLAGLAAWFAMELYAQLVRDPVLYGGQSVPPEFLEAAQQSLLVGSIVVVVYGQILTQGSADSEPGWLRSLAIGVQWGIPTLIALDAIVGGVSNLGFLVLVSLLAGVIAILGIITTDRPN